MRRRDVAADVGQDYAVGRVSAGRGAVGDVHAGPGSKVAARTGDAVDRRPSEDRVEDSGLRDRSRDWARRRPRSTAVVRDRDELGSGMALRGNRPDAEDVSVAVAVGPDRAAVKRIALAVVGCRSDWMSAPRRTAVARHGDLELGGRGVALLLAHEVGPADIDAAEEGTRGCVVGPDLLLVGERRGRLVRDEHRCHPRCLVARGCRLDVVRPRHRYRLKAFERLLGTGGAEVRRQVGVVEPGSIRPAEGAVDRLGSERDGRITI